MKILGTYLNALKKPFTSYPCHEGDGLQPPHRASASLRGLCGSCEHVWFICVYVRVGVCMHVLMGNKMHSSL